MEITGHRWGVMVCWKVGWKPFHWLKLGAKECQKDHKHIGQVECRRNIKHPCDWSIREWRGRKNSAEARFKKYQPIYIFLIWWKVSKYRCKTATNPKQINTKNTRTRVSSGHCRLHFLWTFLSLDAFRKILMSNGHPVVISDFSVMEFTHLPPSWASMIPHAHLASPLKTVAKSKRRWDEVHRHDEKLHGPMFSPSPPGCTSSPRSYNSKPWSILWWCLPCPQDLYNSPFISGQHIITTRYYSHITFDSITMCLGFPERTWHWFSLKQRWRK